jgi:hypothetical protein
LDQKLCEILDSKANVSEASNTKNFKYSSKKKRENRTMLNRSTHTKEALIHFISISEVKDLKSDVIWVSKAFISKWNFELCF